MKKLLAFCLVFILLTSFRGDEESFTGKIVYKYTFTDLAGNDITEKLAPFFGAGQHYFIDSKNYKGLNEKLELVQLYNSETNKYHYYSADGVKVFDGSTVTSQKADVTRLDKKEKVAGYECLSVKLETDNSETVYYYSPLVKVNPKAFEKHNFGEWNKYLQASGGGITLKFVLTNRKNGYIWTSVATEVVKMKLKAKDFAPPADKK